MRSFIISLFIFLLSSVSFAQMADDSVINPVTGEIDKIGISYTDGEAQSATGWTKTDDNVYLTVSTDNVGIGTDDPKSVLEVYGSPETRISINSNPTGDPSIIQDIGNVVDTLGDVSSTEYRVAQSFSITKDTTILGSAWKFGANVGSPSGNVTVTIETDSSNSPSGVLANPSATTTYIPTPNSWNTYTYTPFQLSAGKYWLRLYCNNQSTNVRWRPLIVLSNEYAGGDFSKSINGGAFVPYTDLYDAVFAIYTSSGVISAIDFKKSSNTIFSLGIDYYDDFNISNSTSNLISIDSTGNVGIGTTTPINRLDVYGGLSIGTSYAGSIIAPTSGLLVAGNVGIGTAITRAKLDVEGTAYIKGNVGIGTISPTKRLSIADACIQLKSPDGSLSNCCVGNDDAFACTGI